MDIENFRNYCLSKKGVEESFPFDENTFVLKVGGKIFAITDISKFEFINLKNIPEKVEELQEMYSDIKPGYHMSKKHWVSVYINNELKDNFVYGLIDQSYNIIYNGLTKKQKLEIDFL